MLTALTICTLPDMLGYSQRHVMQCMHMFLYCAAPMAATLSTISIAYWRCCAHSLIRVPTEGFCEVHILDVHP